MRGAVFALLALHVCVMLMRISLVAADQADPVAEQADQPNQPTLPTDDIMPRPAHQIMTEAPVLSTNMTPAATRKPMSTSAIKPSTVFLKGISGTSVPRSSDSPMLNYIFDMHSTLNRNHHHDHRFGPHFEDVEVVGNTTNMTVQIGSTASMSCRIRLLQDKTVSWVRRRHDSDELQLLTVGTHTYSGDDRYAVDFQYPNNWRLRIRAADKRDEGFYECQISTHPPKVIRVNLHINAPEVMIVNEHGVPLLDKYYEADSTIQLTCIVRHVSMTSSVVTWRTGDRILNYDTRRGGINVRTEMTEAGANSSLFVARVNTSDSGNYTCSIGPDREYTLAVHVLNAESLAQLQHASTSDVRATWLLVMALLVSSAFAFL